MYFRLLWIALLGSSALHAATRPAPPVILEPAADRQSVSAADVHLATGQFYDEDGDHHRCTDWEIRILQNVIWSAPCAAGSHKTHIHLGDGTFAGNAKGLQPATGYWLYVRHRDDSGEPDTEWSEWSERFFLTDRELPMPPLMKRDVLASPAPRWMSVSGVGLVPPMGARLRLELVDGDVLLELGRAGDALVPMRRQRFDTNAPLRLSLEASDEEWSLPESNLTFCDGDGVETSVYLPAVTIPADERIYFWISENGSTHTAKAAERSPDFNNIRRGAPVPWRVLQPGYRVERVAGGFQLPVNLAFIPHPREGEDAPLFYVTELYGDIKVVTRSGDVRDYATKLLDFDPHDEFPGPGEIGLTGITVEPESGDVIAALLYSAWPGLNVVWPRIIRIHSDDGGLTAARIETILDMPGEDQSESHQISNITIGPDGYLYVHLGDSLRAELAQDPKTVRGKIIRVALDGSAPPNNPFYDSADGITATDYIFALGFRNPFGGAWRAADMMLYEVENGPATDRLAQVVRGRNYLWDGTDESMRHYATATFGAGTAPVGLAFVQRETFGGSGFPESKLGRVFVSQSGPTWASGPQKAGKRIEEIALSEDGTQAVARAPLLEYDGTGKGSISGIAAGPDGLYFCGLYKDYGYQSPVDRGADLFRVRWVGEASVGVGLTGDPLAIAFDERSDVPESERWEWDFGDGTTSGERNPMHRYDREGTYVVRLSVTGSRGTVTAAKKIDLRTEGSGLVAEFFAGEDLTRLLHIESAEAIDFDWRSAPIADLPATFSVRWSGGIRSRFSETYRFSVNVATGARLLIDGVEILGDSVKDGEVELEAGELHDFVVEYVHRADATTLQLSWESESQPREVVPSSAFFAPQGPRRRAVAK